MSEYEALISRPENLALIRAARPAIEAVSGQVSIAAPTKTGLVRVTLCLPPPYTPAMLVPGLPFYPL